MAKPWHIILDASVIAVNLANSQCSTRPQVVEAVASVATCWATFLLSSCRRHCSRSDQNLKPDLKNRCTSLNWQLN